MRKIKLLLALLFLFPIAYLITVPRYHNLYESGEPNFLDFIKWKFTRDKPLWPELPKIKPTNPKPNFPAATKEDEIAVTYVNHSSFLIQMAGKNILTDPIWSMYAGPFGKFGVKRSIYPGVNIEDLPQIDYILISHSHYDHLDLPSIDLLTKNHKPIIIAGLGVTRYIKYCQEYKKNCKELNWWEKSDDQLNTLSFHFVPAYHWSSRYLLDKNTSLWGGFIIENAKDSIYFSGDTGYGDGKIFEEIADRFPNIHLSLLPIGAYKPSWFFSRMHISPLEAVKIHKIVKSKYSVPIHFDTFELTDEKYTDPLQDLKKALHEEELDEYIFKVLKPGETWQVYPS